MIGAQFISFVAALLFAAQASQIGNEASPTLDDALPKASHRSARQAGYLGDEKQPSLDNQAERKGRRGAGGVS